MPEITAAHVRAIADKLAAYDALVAALRDVDTLPTPEGVEALAALRGITRLQTDTEIAEALVRRYSQHLVSPVRVRDTLDAARGQLQRETENVAKIREALGAGDGESTLDAVARVVRARDAASLARDNAHAREHAAHTILTREGVPEKSDALGHDGTIPVRLEWLFGNRHVEAAARRDLARVQAALDAAGVDKTGDSASRIERLALEREAVASRDDIGRAQDKLRRILGLEPGESLSEAVQAAADKAAKLGAITHAGNLRARIDRLTRHDPRAAAIAATKLDECELWLKSAGG